MEAWLEDIPLRFHIYLEYPKDVNTIQYRQQCIKLGDALGGVILSSDVDIDLPCPVYKNHYTGQPVQLTQQA